MGLISELRRRSVLRMAVLYLGAAWLILQVVDILIDRGPLPESLGPLTLTVLVIGFPIALALSWFYEVTPEGVVRDHDERSDAAASASGRRVDFVIIAVLSAAVLLFAYDKWWIGPPPDRSIAVLAFENLSGDPDQDYFSDGISEELLNVLSRLPGLQVAARTSSFQFKGENRDVIDIGQKLNTAFILEGSVRKAGRQVRITAQLIDASNGFHLWSDTYDRDLEDIFAVQDEISAAIAGALKELLGLQVSTPPRVVATQSAEAYEAYLRGRYLVVQRTETSIEGAAREFEQAIELDPDFAAAHAELAYCLILIRDIVMGYGSLTGTEAIARAIPHAERAMTLDPNLAEAHYVTGLLHFDQGNLEQALTHLRQAIQINPNFARAYLAMGAITNTELGRYDEGFAITEKALRLDPLSIPTRANYINQLLARNRLDEADREIEKLAAMSPREAAELRFWRRSVGGNWANSILGDLDSLLADPDQGYGALDRLGYIFAIIGLEKEALAISDERLPDRLNVAQERREAVTAAEAWLAENPTSFYASTRLGWALASAGEYERARPLLEDAWKRSGGRVTSCCLFFADRAAALIAARRDAGEDTGVDELIAAMRDNVRRLREAGINSRAVDYEEGLTAYLAGEHERGLALIAKAVERGFRIFPWQAFLQEMIDDPGFAPILAKQDALHAREREKVLAIVCNDNPYEAVWQPAEGTCEQFAAAHAN